MCRIVYLQIRCLCVLQLSAKLTINLFLVIQDKLNYVIYCSNDIISRIRRRILIGTGLIVILVGVRMFLGTRNQDFCTRYLYRTVLGSILQSTLRNALRVKLAIIQQLYSWIGQENDQLQYPYETLLQLGNQRPCSYYMWYGMLAFQRQLYPIGAPSLYQTFGTSSANELVLNSSYRLQTTRKQIDRQKS